MTIELSPCPSLSSFPVFLLFLSQLRIFFPPSCLDGRVSLVEFAPDHVCPQFGECSLPLYNWRRVWSVRRTGPRAACFTGVKLPFFFPYPRLGRVSHPPKNDRIVGHPRSPHTSPSPIDPEPYQAPLRKWRLGAGFFGRVFSSPSFLSPSFWVVPFSKNLRLSLCQVGSLTPRHPSLKQLLTPSERGVPPLAPLMTPRRLALLPGSSLILVCVRAYDRCRRTFSHSKVFLLPSLSLAPPPPSWSAAPRCDVETLPERISLGRCLLLASAAIRASSCAQH